jgi:hypothetical protein
MPGEERSSVRPAHRYRNAGRRWSTSYYRSTPVRSGPVKPSQLRLHLDILRRWSSLRSFWLPSSRRWQAR